MKSVFKKFSKSLNVNKSLNTITTKLLMLFLFMTIIPLIVLAQFSTELINSNMTSRAKWQVELNGRIAKNQYNESLLSLKNLMVQGVSTPVDAAFKDYQKDKNHQDLSHKLKTIARKGNYNFLYIVDKDSKILANSLNTRNGNKLNSFSHLVNKVLLSGEPFASTEVFLPLEIKEEGEELVKKAELFDAKLNKKIIAGISQVVVMPILDESQDIVALSLAGNFLLNNNQIGDSIRELTGATFMVSQILHSSEATKNDAIVILTNLVTGQGQRNSGTIIPYSVVNKVLANHIYQGREWQVREYQLGQYYPVLNSRGNIIGINYIGISEKPFTLLAEQNIALVSWISVLGLFCAILLSSIFSRSITSPILKLAEAAKNISKGDLGVRVNVKGSTEISQMGETFNHMAETLQREEQLRDDFVATLTHDLKVPLLAENQIVTYLLSQQYGEINEEQREVLQEIKITNSATIEMVNTLLEVYRYDAGNNVLLKSKLDIRNLVETSAKSLNALVEEKKLNLSVSLPETEYIVDVDEREIKRVMHNLIANAIACTLRRGSIRVTIAHYKDKKLYSPEDKDFQHTTLKRSINIEDHVIVSVYDTGIGMEEEEIQNLFKRFSGNKGRKPSSIGLGLYYSKQVLTAHNGNIWAESQEGEGSVFKFTLPLVVEAPKSV